MTEVPKSVIDLIKSVTEKPKSIVEKPFSMTTLMTDAPTLPRNMTEVP